jgi:hypothetical protein
MHEGAVCHSPFSFVQVQLPAMHHRRSRFARRVFKAFWVAPPAIRIAVAIAAFLALAFAVNWTYQVGRKPAELFFPVSGVLAKTPAETWRQYGPIFRDHSTPVMTPELLAALAQVEGAGNPVARTNWRWRLTSAPGEIYRPASSAVGMYQITDATYADARRYCIHDHTVMREGPWHDPGSCWFNSLYLRVVPSHAVEMTSALLDRRAAEVLERHRIKQATRQQKQDLAAIIHLCGGAVGDAYAKHQFRLAAGQRCGEHDVQTYLKKVNVMKRVFLQLG